MTDNEIYLTLARTRELLFACSVNLRGTGDRESALVVDDLRSTIAERMKKIPYGMPLKPRGKESKR